MKIYLRRQITLYEVDKKEEASTLVSWIVEHIEISEHLAKFAEKLLVEHLFYTISIATNKRTPGTFFITAQIVRLLGTPEYAVQGDWKSRVPLGEQKNKK